MFQRVANKFADIDFTKYQYLHARTTDAAETAGSGRGRIVPVKPVPTALVENWRHLESYECDGDTSYSEDSAAPLITLWRHGRLQHANAWDQGCLASGPYSGLPPCGGSLATPAPGSCPVGADSQGCAL